MEWYWRSLIIFTVCIVLAVADWEAGYHPLIIMLVLVFAVVGALREWVNREPPQDE